MKTIWTYLKPYKKECVLAPLFKMLEATFELYVPLVISALVDIGIASGDVAYIRSRCLILVALALIGLTCAITAQYFAAKAGVGCASSMRYSLFRHIQSLSFTELDTLGTSTLITRMTSDVNQVQNGVNLVLRLFLRSPFVVFGAMIMAFTIDKKASMIFLLAIVLLSLVVFGIMTITRPLYRKVQMGLDQILGITRENITGVRVIRAFHKEAAEANEFRRENEKLNQTQKFVGRISGLMNPLTYLIVNGAILFLLWSGAIRIESGTLTQGQVIALYNYMSQILVELIKLANLIISISKALACSRRIAHVFSVESSMQEGTYETQEELADEDIAVEFKHVTLQYQTAGEPSLTDISFAAKKGETIGIIGGTGSGKSSLVHLIPRFYDATDGQVLVYGKDVREYRMQALRRLIGIVMQKNRLFIGSLRENICWGKSDASDAEIEEALTVSQAKEVVLKKENQLEEAVEQGGRNFSGGQRQRLAIARAMVRKPKILILDDSSSALDYATEAALRRELGGLEFHPTTFIVSQRAASIMHADQILVLEDGQMVGKGTHEQLLAECETYQEIYYSQFPKEQENEREEGEQA